MKIGICATVAVAALALCACATVTRGTNETFVVNTTPGGAHVALSTGQTCDSTPCTFPRIPRKAEFSVTITKPGYVTSTHAVAHRTAGGGAAGMAGNVILGGIIGAVVDANSGATQELVPNPLTIVLEPEGGAAIATATPTPEATATPAAAAPTSTAAPAMATPAVATAAPAATPAGTPAPVAAPAGH